MIQTIDPMLSLALLAWAVISVIWLTIAIGQLKDSREDTAVARRARDHHRKDARLKQQRIDDLIDELRILRSQHEWNLLGNAVLAELEESVRRPSYRKLTSNTDKVLDYYRK